MPECCLALLDIRNAVVADMFQIETLKEYCKDYAYLERVKDKESNVAFIGCICYSGSVNHSTEQVGRKQIMTRKQFKDLRKAQQGELDAVLMYNALADTVSDPADAETFRKLAAEEGRHGSVFIRYTQQTLKPRRTKAILLPFLYRALGRKITYRLIARGEYDAARAYEHLIPAFPEVESIQADEQRHGDTVKALLTHKESGKKRVLRAILLAAGGLALAGCAYFALSHRRYCRK